MTEQSALEAALDAAWLACARQPRPDYIVVPGWWFERVPARRLGRRLIRGRWRLSARGRASLAWWNKTQK